MKHHRTRKAVSLLLSLLMAVQLLPLEAGAASAMEGKKAGDVLFNNEEKDRLFVSETAYSLAPGITEYVTYTNEPDGLNQNIDYFCEVDLSQAEVMTGYAGMENILEKKTINWRMQTVSGQVEDTQSYFTRSEKYADCTIAAALNADYYNMATGQPTGLLIIDGKVYNPSSGGYYFGIDKKSGKAVISNDKSEAALAELSYAVGGGSLLVKDGKVNVGNGGRNVTYSAIGIKPDGTVVSMVCYGQSYPISCGYNQYEVAQMMKARGCQTAVLLDGSGSSTFVSRRDGDSKPQTRNHPSDGQERQVSSSIFFISRAKADGIFDHATIAPTNEVYTPGSVVNFTAAGADRSGAPAPLPSGLTWTVDADYGIIDSATGVFQSNGTAGDVRVYLNQGGTQVGSAIITIADPDQITFAEASVSMGNGDTGDLGLRVYYQQRGVHYRDGDLDWSIQPTQYSRKEYVFGTRYETVTETNPNRMQYLTVGTVSNNKLTITPVYTGTNLNQGTDYTLAEIEKTATAITATVTVSSKTYPDIKGFVTLNACKEPQVFMDFEQGKVNIFHGMTADGANDFVGQFVDGTYSKFSSVKSEKDLQSEGYDMVCVSYNDRHASNPKIGTAEVVSRADDYPVRFGDYSLKVDYNIPGSPSKNDGVCFGPTEELQLSDIGNPSRIGVWVYVPKGTPNLWMRLRYKDGAGNISNLDFAENSIYMPNSIARNADDGWHYFEADISKLQTPVTLPAGMAIRVMYCPVTTFNTSSTMPEKAWASPVGWVKCETDKQGNIILADRTDTRLTEFTGRKLVKADDLVNGSTATPGTKRQVTLSTGDVVDIGEKLPIPQYLATTMDEAKGGYSGTLYFDNLTFVYGSTTEDKTNPVIESVIVNQEKELQTGMSFASSSIDIQATYHDSDETDKNSTGVDYAALYVDGRKVDCIASTSELRAGLKLANGSHTIKISVVDGYGNETAQSYQITVNDPEGEGAPIQVTAHEASAVLGRTVTLDFTPRDNSVASMTADVQLPAAFAQGYVLTDAQGETIEADYNSATEVLRFTVDGAVNSGPMATLTVKVPTSAVPGANFTCIVSGLAGEASFSDTITLPISAPYTVSAGRMVVGLPETCYFLITHSASGQPALGVGLYQGETLLGTSDAEGKVFVTVNGEETTLTVTARDSEGGVSSALTAAVYLPQGKADGTPTHVWRNAADSADSLNVGWLADPTKAAEGAKLRLAESQDALAEGTVYDGTCRLLTFTDGAAAYVCGAKAEDLKSGTTYYYQVGDGTHWSEIRSFTTGYVNTDVEALIFGDLQESNNTTLTGILNGLDLTDYDLTIQTGDLVDNGGNYSYWDKTFTMLDGLTGSRLFAVGNHEQDGSGDPNTTFYNQGDSNYYSAVYGNVFVATLAYNGFTAESLAKLVRDAQASNATWKILVMHQPVYYTNAVAGMSAAAQQQVYTAAQEAGIDVVLSGHDHSYARTEPLYNGAVDNEKGITYFICGSLGEKSYGITDNEAFHFVKLEGNYNAVYLTLSTTSDTLRIQAYDYSSGNAKLLDSFTKQKSGEHSHSYQWDGGSRLVCNCGYNISAASYTGYAGYTLDGKSGQVYFNAGTLMTGVFAVGEDVVHHAGENGFIHNSETINTAKCWENGYLGCWCKDCNKFFQMTEKRRQGHLYDEDHVCTCQVFNTDTFEWEVCGLQGKDIATLDATLAYKYGFYTGEAKRPAVTVKDGDYTLFPQSTYGDYMPYWENNVNVGLARVRIVGYADGPYYGERVLTFEVVPQNLSASDFTTETTANSVRLSWNAAPGATQYIVSQNIDGTWTRLGVTDAPEYTVTGLDQGKYQFRVRPFAEVEGVNYYSTKNSPVVAVTLDASALRFSLGSRAERSYGDEAFINAASFDGDTAGFTYSSGNADVAEVNAETGEVTIRNAGTAVITATNGTVTGEYRLVVLPKQVEITWNIPEDLVYNGQPAQVTAEVASGLLEGDDCQVSVSGGQEIDAGTHTATAAGLSNPNYALSAERTVQYTIQPAVLHELIWSNTELTYTGTPIAPTATAKAGVVEGDTVTFAVPTAVEAGSYVVSAVSRNSNYVVAEDANTCRFTIAMPEITLAGADGDQLTWYLGGSTIYVCGITSMGAVTVSVTAKLLGGAQSASAQVTCGQTDGSVSMGGITYTVNAEKLIAALPEIDLVEGENQMEIPPELELEEDAKAELEEAANAEDNGLNGLNASLAAGAEDLVRNALGETEMPESGVELKTYGSMTVVEYVPGTSYTVDIVPSFELSEKDSEAEPIAKGVITNAQLEAPVEVVLEVPAGITLDENTYVRHIHADGSSNYIKPHRIERQTLYFYTDSFSRFQVVSDSRSASIAFPTEDGVQVRIYGPENIGTELPSVEAPEGKTFKGWKIGEETYTSVTEELLDALADAEDTVQAEPVFQDKEQGGGTIPGGGGGIRVETYPITVAAVENGAVSLDQKSAAEGDTVTITAKAEEGHQLKSIAAVGEDGAAIALTDKGNGTYQFTMPGTAVEIRVEFVEEKTFPDVAEGSYCDEAVKWAVKNGITLGFANGLFAPGQSCTRAQIVTFLWRAAGSPAPKTTVNPFQDIQESMFCYQAVLWAVENGVTKGTTETTFSPNDTCTCGQSVTFLYRAVGMQTESQVTFPDVAADSYCADAVAWAVENGVTKGLANGLFGPNENCTRGQIVTFLYRTYTKAN